MTYKSATQPYCRYSGKPIPKHTATVYFGVQNTAFGRVEFPRSKEEAQSLVDGRIVSLRWHRANRDYRGQNEPDHDYIRWVGVWDGETYVDQYFASQPNAVAFAYLMARNDHCTKAYTKAWQKKVAALV